MKSEPHEDTSLLSRPTPLPLAQVLLIALLVFGNAFSIILLYPFLPFMTADFFPHLPNRELGYKAGFLGSVFFVGSLSSSYLLGVLADRIGRRPVLMWGSFLLIFWIIAFGFSTSFTWALWMRFLWGATCGTVGVAKTYLSEILDESNSARGFSVLGLMFSLGRLLSPVVAGFLSKPAEKYPMFDTELFRSFPYLLPCLVAAGIALLGFIGSILWLRETLQDEPKAEKSVDEESGGEEESDGVYVFSHDTVFLSCLLYALLAFIGIMWTDTFPLWVINATEDGGFNFTTGDIGVVYTVCAPFEIFNMLVLYPLVAARLTLVQCIQYAFFGVACMLFIIPFTSLMTEYSAPLQWFCLCTASALLTGCFDYCYNNVFLLINNSTTKKYRGRVNGVAGQMASVGRAIAPSLASIVFAWSETSGHDFPFNYHFVYILASIVALGCTGLTTLLPDSINRPPKEN